MPNGKPIEFNKILAELIQARGYTRARKKICIDVGISASALTQYLQGEVRPSFEKLVRLAKFFDVSLDYLVFGSQPTTTQVADYGPVVRYMDMALASLQMKIDRHALMFARIGGVLSSQVNNAAKEIADSSPSSAGLLRDEETMVLEAYSNASFIVSLNLQYDIIKPEGQPEAAGRFLQIVAQNLSQGCKYRFLVPTEIRDWKPVVGSYVKLLQKHCGNDKLVIQNCKFRQTKMPLFAGCGLYLLDVPRFSIEQSILYERVRHMISKDGCIGYIIPPSNELQADALMDLFHVDVVRKALEKLWKLAEPI